MLMQPCLCWSIIKLKYATANSYKEKEISNKIICKHSQSYTGLRLAELFSRWNKFGILSQAGFAMTPNMSRENPQGCLWRKLRYQKLISERFVLIKILKHFACGSPDEILFSKVECAFENHWKSFQIKTSRNFHTTVCLLKHVQAVEGCRSWRAKLSHFASCQSMIFIQQNENKINEKLLHHHIQERIFWKQKNKLL